MGPIEAELRGAPGPEASDRELWAWAWERSDTKGPDVTAFTAISDVYVPINGKRLGSPGFGISLHSKKGRIRDAISEAIEACAALGL